MKRTAIEKGIIERFAPLVSQHDFELVTEDYTGANHLVEFKFRTNDMIYFYIIRFIKSHYMQHDSEVTIYSDRVSALYKKLNPDDDHDNWPVFNFRMNGYLHPKNAGGVFTSNIVDSYIDKIPVTKERLDILANELYNDFFLPIINRIIPATNSDEKLDHLINDLPGLMETGKEIPILMFSVSLVDQVLNGVMLARIQRRADYQRLVKRYLEFAEEFPPGDIEEIDRMRKAIELFEKEDKA